MRRMLFVGLAGVLLFAAPPVSAQAPAAPPASCDAAGAVQFVCGQAGPEDLVVVPGEQWVVASAYGGEGGVLLVHTPDKRVVRAYPSASAKDRYDAKAYPGCPGPPPKGFTTHGLYVQAGRNAMHRLYTVSHGMREAVDVFEMDLTGANPALTWIGCAIAPEPIGLNSVRALPDGGFVATDFLSRGPDSQGRMRQMMVSGEKNGALWQWQPASGWTKIAGSEASGANGIEISDDGRWFYVAAWGTQSFFRLARGGASPQRDEIPLGFRVDNIHWARDGSLLAAGQSDKGFVAVKIDPKAMTFTEVLRQADMPAFRGGTVAVEVGRTLWVGSFTGDRLAVFPAPAGR